MKTRYEQGRAELKRQAAKCRRRTVGRVLGIILLVIIAGMVLSALAGCATTVAVKGKLVEVGDHRTISGLVRISQMGEDCASEQEALRRTIADLFVSQGVPRPSIVEVRPLAGSSYCGFSQGTASEVTMLELGARNTAVVKATLYWSAITKTDLRKAEAFLADMRPIPAPRNLGAKLR